MDLITPNDDDDKFVRFHFKTKIYDNGGSNLKVRPSGSSHELPE